MPATGNAPEQPVNHGRTAMALAVLIDTYCAPRPGK